MTDFDDFDDRFLADMLNAASGSHPDESAAYGAVMGRVRTVRRRRAAIVSGATAAVMMIGVSVFALRAGTGGQSLEPAGTGPDGAPISTVAPDRTDPDATSPDDSVPDNTSSDGSSPDDSSVDDSDPDDSTPDDSTPDDSTPDDSTPDDGSTGTSGPGTQPGATPGTTTGGVGTTPAPTTPSVAPTNPPATTPTTRPPTTQPPTTQPPATTSPTTAPPTTAPPTTAPPTTAPAITRTFSCLGGSATVRLNGGVLTLLGSSPAAGFALESSEARPDRVRILWESDNATSRLEVRPAGGSMSSSCADDVDEDDDEDEDEDENENEDGEPADDE
jgi:hypothetical protein